MRYLENVTTDTVARAMRLSTTSATKTVARVLRTGTPRSKAVYEPGGHKMLVTLVRERDESLEAIPTLVIESYQDRTPYPIQK